MSFLNKDSLSLGILSGIFMPLFGFGLLQGLFIVLSNLVNSGYGNWSMRTITLLAICFNLIPFNYYKKRRYENSMRGIIVPTVILAIIWAVLHRDYIFGGA